MTPLLLAGAAAAPVVLAWGLSFVALALLTFPYVTRLTGGVSLARSPALYRRLLGVGLKLSVANAATLVNARIALVVLVVFADEATSWRLLGGSGYERSPLAHRQRTRPQRLSWHR